jgi:hypothetical protein
MLRKYKNGYADMSILKAEDLELKTDLIFR